jgi:HK97 family phage major capsid protein/HK97 family phage prohead protease
MRQMKLKPQIRYLAAREAKIDSEKRTMEFSFSSEEPVDWGWGTEILSHERDAADLSRLNNNANLLFNHNWDQPIGVIEKAWVGNDKRGYVSTRFSKNPQADQIFKDVQDGILHNVSFGYEVKELALTKSNSNGSSEYTSTKWMPFEVSIVTVPADPTVGVGRSKFNEEKEVPVIEEKMAEEIQPITIIENKGETMTPEELKAAEEKARKDATQSERERASQIHALCEKHKMETDFARKLVEDGKSIEEARQVVLEKLSIRQTSVSGSPEGEGLLGLSPKEVRNFRFLNIIRALANPTDRKLQEAAKFEREVSEAGAKKRGKASQGFFIPMDVLSSRDLTKGTDSAGGYLVETQLVGFIELLRKKSIFQRAGATVLNGLVGDIAIPKQTGGATAYWVDENVAPTEGAQTFGQVALSPKTVGCYTDISRKLMNQSSIDVENLVRSDLSIVTALAVDVAAAYGLGSGGQPNGLKNLITQTTDFAADAPTWSEVVGLESLVAASDADVGTMGYLMNATMRGYLKATAKASNAPIFIWDQGQVNGYNPYVSNQIAAGDLFFGNWADLMFGFWSGLDVLVDPYTGGAAGTVRVRVLQDVDVAARHLESFARGNNTL